MAVKFPIDFVKIRKALAREVQRTTGLTCILEEPETTQPTPRPALPYFSYKLIAPAIKVGDDSADNVGGTVWNRGGQRKLMVDFNCYACTHEEAYSYMALWQSSLELETIQGDLRSSGIAVWLNGSVRDLSKLLNTATEGRAQMELAFGVAANLTEDLSSIDEANATGTVTTDQGATETVTIHVIAP